MKPRQPSFSDRHGRGQVPSPADPQRDLKDERADSLFERNPLKRLFCCPGPAIPLLISRSDMPIGEEIV
jgi:hypothetical protein